MGLFDGPTTTQTSTSTSAPPQWMQGNWQNYINNINGLTANGTVPVYGGQTVAGRTGAQNTALDMGFNLATGGSPASNMANAAITAQASGAITNPYATTTNPWEGQQNSFMGQTNPYAGNNPYLQSMIDSSNADITKAYSQGTAAQTDAAFNQAGAFGGSAYQNQVANNQDMLGKNLAANTSGLRYNNYLNSGQLAQNDLARNAGISGQDLARNSGLADNTLNRATNAFADQSKNQLIAADLGLKSGQMDWNAIGNLNALGTQQQGDVQNNLNGMQNWWQQTAMGPYANADIRRNAYSSVPGSSVTSTGTAAGGGASPWVNGIGAIGSLWNLFGGGGP